MNRLSISTARPVVQVRHFAAAKSVRKASSKTAFRLEIQANNLAKVGKLEDAIDVFDSIEKDEISMKGSQIG